MIPCEPCQCGAVSKTIQRSEPDDFVTLLERTHQIGLELVTADESKPDCLLQRRDET